MDRGDEIWLPDGRVMPYRRAAEAAASAPVGRPRRDVTAMPRRRSSRDRRRHPRSDDGCGRELNITA